MPPVAIVAAHVRRAPHAALAVASIALLATLVATDAPAELRAPATLWVLATAAGLAWVPVIGLGEGVGAAVTVVGVSLAAGVLLATALMYVGLSVTAPGGLLALALVCAPGCALQLRGAPGGQPPLTPGSAGAGPGRAPGSPGRPGGTARG